MTAPPGHTHPEGGKCNLDVAVKSSTWCTVITGVGGGVDTIPGSRSTCVRFKKKKGEDCEQRDLGMKKVAVSVLLNPKTQGNDQLISVLQSAH